MRQRKTIGMKQKRLAVLCAVAFGATGFGVVDTASAQSTGGGNFLERKPGDGFTLITRGGEISLYGMLDVSIDDTTKGLGSVKLDGASPPAGNSGWMPAISSNLSYVGVRGFQGLSDSTRFVYQLETQIDVSNTPGTQ